MPSRITANASLAVRPSGARHIHRINGRCVRELHEINDPCRFGTYLVEVLIGKDHVAALLKLIALHNLRVGYLALAVRAPSLLLDAGLAFAVELVEGDRAARFGGREDFYRN